MMVWSITLLFEFLHSCVLREFSDPCLYAVSITKCLRSCLEDKSTKKTSCMARYSLNAQHLGTFQGTFDAKTFKAMTNKPLEALTRYLRHTRYTHVGTNYKYLRFRFARKCFIHTRNNWGCGHWSISNIHWYFFENLQKSTYLLNCFKPSLGIFTLVYSFTF